MRIRLLKMIIARECAAFRRPIIYHQSRYGIAQTQDTGVQALEVFSGIRYSDPFGMTSRSLPCPPSGENQLGGFAWRIAAITGSADRSRTARIFWNARRNLFRRMSAGRHRRPLSVTH